MLGIALSHAPACFNDTRVRIPRSLMLELSLILDLDKVCVSRSDPGKGIQYCEQTFAGTEVA